MLPRSTAKPMTERRKSAFLLHVSRSGPSSTTGADGFFNIDAFSEIRVTAVLFSPSANGRGIVAAIAVRVSPLFDSTLTECKSLTERVDGTPRKRQDVRPEPLAGYLEFTRRGETNDVSSMCYHSRCTRLLLQ